MDLDDTESRNVVEATTLSRSSWASVGDNDSHTSSFGSSPNGENLNDAHHNKLTAELTAVKLQLLKAQSDIDQLRERQQVELAECQKRYEEQLEQNKALCVEEFQNMENRRSQEFERYHESLRLLTQEHNEKYNKLRTESMREEIDFMTQTSETYFTLMRQREEEFAARMGTSTCEICGHILLDKQAKPLEDTFPPNMQHIKYALDFSLKMFSRLPEVATKEVEQLALMIYQQLTVNNMLNGKICWGPGELKAVFEERKDDHFIDLRHMENMEDQIVELKEDVEHYKTELEHKTISLNVYVEKYQKLKTRLKNMQSLGTIEKEQNDSKISLLEQQMRRLEASTNGGNICTRLHGSTGIRQFRKVYDDGWEMSSRHQMKIIEKAIRDSERESDPPHPGIVFSGSQAIPLNTLESAEQGSSQRA